MRRRDFILASGAALAATPIRVAAQPAAKRIRIGLLVTGTVDSELFRSVLGAFREGMRERGYVEGRDFDIEVRAAEGDVARLPGLARELVEANPDVIHVGATPGALAARQATSTIPIVAAAMGDPVGDGLARTLARPGGNVTGFTTVGPELVTKILGLLKEAVPAVTRVAAFWQSHAFGAQTEEGIQRDAKSAARAVGLQVELIGVRTPDDLERALAALPRSRHEAIAVLPGTLLFIRNPQIAAAALRLRLPSVGATAEYAGAGGLVGYGTSIADLYRRSAGYVDRILKGAKPGELPIERPTKFELVINAKTAKALGIAIPKPLLLRADEVIQ